MITAVKIDCNYPDLLNGKEYEVVRIFYNGQIELKDNPRRYFADSFIFKKNGKKTSFKELYRMQQIDKVKEKLGIK